MRICNALMALAMYFAASAAWANQPHMEAALVSLEQAKASLQKADDNKGGHRVKAIKAVEAAIAEVKVGIEFAKKK